MDTADPGTAQSSDFNEVSERQSGWDMKRREREKWVMTDSVPFPLSKLLIYATHLWI